MYIAVRIEIDLMNGHVSTRNVLNFRRMLIHQTLPLLNVRDSSSTTTDPHSARSE